MSINLSLNKLPWYGQIGLFVALSLGAVGAFWNWSARGAMANIESQKAQLASINQNIERGLTTAKRLPELRREVEQLEAQLERLRAVLPEEQDVADLLRHVQAMATQSRLTIRGFTPHAVTKRQMHAEWPIGLAARRHVSRPGHVPRACQQVPTNHQRGRHSHQVGGCTVERLDDHCGLHCDDIRPARRATSSSGAGGRCENGVTPVTRALSIVPFAFVLTTGVGLAQTSHAGGPASPVSAVVPAAAAAPATAIVPATAPDAVESQGFTYNPDGRRDPFVSLLRRGADSAPVAAAAKREAGLAGLGAAEISLRGTIKSAGTFVGIVQGADGKTYIVRAGDKLADGSIRTITADSMVILQQVSDPLSPGRVQEVRKGLRQTEEGK